MYACIAFFFEMSTFCLVSFFSEHIFILAHAACLCVALDLHPSTYSNVHVAIIDSSSPFICIHLSFARPPARPQFEVDEEYRRATEEELRQLRAEASVAATKYDRAMQQVEAAMTENGRLKATVRLLFVLV